MVISEDSRQFPNLQILTIVYFSTVQPGPVQDLVANCVNGSDVVTFLSPKKIEHMCFHIHVKCAENQVGSNRLFIEQQIINPIASMFTLRGVVIAAEQWLILSNISSCQMSF